MPHIGSNETTNENEAHYRRAADALAAVANRLYHSHRQGVILLDFPVIGLYDNNGGASGREEMWAEMIRQLPEHGYEILATGEFTIQGDTVPYTRALLVRCVFTDRGTIQTSQFVRRAEQIRDLCVLTKEATGVRDGHDVMLLTPTERR